MYSLLNKFYEVIPFVSSALLILILSFNSAIFFDYRYSPSVSAICVFFWSFFNPRFIGSFAIFMIGLFSDIISLNPLGLESICLILAAYACSWQREDVIKFGFMVSWGFFAFFLLIFYSIKFLLMILYNYNFIFDGTYLLQFLFTFLLYPLIHKILSYIRIEKSIMFRF